MTKKTPTLNEKLDLILKNQKTILANEEKILGEETKIEALENKEIENENKHYSQEKSALEELEELEKELKFSANAPLKNVTKRDIFKGFIGAFIGVMSHFAFLKGADIALELSFTRATVLYITAFLIIIFMLYYTGFRNIQKTLILRFMPLRATLLYSVSIFTVFIVNFLFGKIVFPIEFIDLYTIIAASIILAAMGAGTADLIGRNE